jgi:hypothetical protein
MKSTRPVNGASTFFDDALDNGELAGGGVPREASMLPAVHRLLDSRMQLDELHTTVQQRVDDVPKWSVQMYPMGALSTNCQEPR